MQPFGQQPRQLANAHRLIHEDLRDDGWLVGTLLDAANQRSGIAVLDAQRIDEGPVAQAWLPYTVPLGFHGHFAAR